MNTRTKLNRDNQLIQDKISDIQKVIIQFYLEKGIQYSWRVNRNPFSIYISEILLQRTQASQVEPIFNEILNKFNTFESILSDFDSFEDITHPLGRSSRNQFIKQGLIYIVNNYNGILPSKNDELLNVPSIGDYISSAIRVFGFNIKDTIIDSNVIRVLSRIYGIDINPELRRNKHFILLAEKTVPDKFLEYSYGILDYAKFVCKSKNPDCISCMISSLCCFFKAQQKR